MYEELKQPIKEFLAIEKGRTLGVGGYFYPNDGEFEFNLLEIDGIDWIKDGKFLKTRPDGEPSEKVDTDDLTDSITDVCNTGSPSDTQSIDAHSEYEVIDVTITAKLLKDGNIDLDVERTNSFTDYDQDESDSKEIDLPEQFQGIFDDGLEIQVGEYSGSGDSGDYNIADSAEAVREEFMTGVRKQFPNIKEQTVFYQMYRDFNIWLTAETEDFVERAPTNFNNEGCFGSVEATFDNDMVRLDTTVNSGFTNNDNDGSLSEII
ncbi:uncharacterized protein METZ01_LOCUS148002 [marine metagenome]|uniref:Uncharacterized protein n=1 Tax=marine metagenome TaxID=408172 RepID=A0A382A0V9_9ZZZZ